ncbi:MAG: putative 2-dehydropantoate 2-reductase [Phycisphaeraceae bacterium]|nr:putative 2-dehydropantoate 2-reductase [Phycisphaeraceae bacterium]
MSDSKLSYAIIGSGALGGYYGARLQHGGADVHFLLHSDYGHVAKHGWTVDSTQHGDITLPKAQAYRAAADMPRCDIVVVGLKSTSNAQLPELLPHVVKDGGCVLTLQNGLGPEDNAAAVVGAENVLGGLCFLCSNKVGPGHIEQTRFDRIKFGEHSRRGITGRMRQIAADFERGAVDIDLAEDLPAARWEKLVWNVPYNGLAAVLARDCSVLMDNDHTTALAHDLMLEVVASAKAVVGHDIPLAFVDKMLNNTKHMGPYRPSMMIDREMGRPMEVEAIYGEPVRRAEAAGVAVPKMRMLYEQLKLLDES